MSEDKFYLEKPRMLGIRGWSLLIPAVLAAVGFCAFAVLALSFTEIQELPRAFRRALVLTGSFALATGGEIGTLSGVVEVFRKRKHAEVWDWLAIIVSAASTIASFVLSWAALLGASATWSHEVKMYGPIVLGVLAALDSYAGFSELGMYLSTYDERRAAWQAAFEDFKRAVLAAEWERAHPAQSEPDKPLAKPDKPRTRLERLGLLLDILRVHPDTDLDALGQELDVSRTTLYNYLSTLTKSGQLKKKGGRWVVLSD